MITYSRKTILWSFFVLASIGASIFSLRYFSRAFPIVNLDIRMSRVQALASAASLAQQYNFGPSGYKQAALFDTDSTVQTYVELEAGGADAYNLMVTGTLYSPYTWQVRHFKPAETHELVIAFMPDGTPYGFVETIAESTTGAALSPEQAETIANKEASEKWGIHFSEYSRVEISKEIRPNGRVDHTFVYERPETRIGKATYRLRLVVTGDKLTAVTHFVKVPEEFIHHYQEMRSANNTVAHAAHFAMMILYMLGIGIIGLFFLLRKKYLIWKTPLIWAGIITLLTTCASLSNFPLYWFFYATTTPTHTFLIQYLYSIFVGSIINLAQNTAIFMIAESLTRLALPNQGQLWKTWSLPGGSSWQTLGRTVSSYLLVPLYFADTIIFYMITMRYLGWWTPAAQLTDPNILASYIPWINAVAPSLSAGFLEECLFRAFPLATAILLGRRYGKERWWIAAAFIIQVLIFGAAHANYATQPAYARLVELVAFSSLMGIIYLKCGLLIGIISHALYDLVWFALPLFISCAPYAWINQLLVILIGILPLIIIIVRRLQKRSWHTLDNTDLNDSWQPEPAKPAAPHNNIEHVPTHRLNSSHVYTTIVIGIVGSITWLLCTRFSSDSLALNLSRGAAENKSRTALLTNGMTIDESWTQLAHIATFNNPARKYPLPGASEIDQHRFVWQKGGKEVYKRLLGNYLQPAHWCVRYLKFDGSVAERAEEYFVALDDTEILRLQHTLPEEYQGAELSESDARTLAHKALREIYNSEPDTFKEVSAVSEKRPHRLDWNFTFADLQHNFAENGQARILITIAGNQRTDNCCYIHVPEDWVRTQETERSIFNLINTLGYSLLFALFLLACILIFRGTSLSVQLRYAVATFATILAFFIIQSINTWPSLIAQLANAQEPYTHQMFKLLGSMFIGFLCAAGAYTVILSLVIQYCKATGEPATKRTMLLASAIGFGWAGLTSFIKCIAPSLEPLWGDFSCLGTHIPVLDVVMGTLSKFILQTIFVVLMLYLLNMFTKNKGRSVIQIGIIIVLGFAIMCAQPIASIQHLLLSGVLVSIFFMIAYYGILAYLPLCAPWIIAIVLACQSIQQALFALYPSALLAHVLALITVCIAAWLWQKIITQPHVAHS